MHTYLQLEPHRALNPYEDSLLKRILSVEFPGVMDLRQQLSFVIVSEECQDCPSIVLNVIHRDALTRAEVERTVPVEAEGRDTDGMKIHFLLYVSEGYLSEMEIYREDLDKIQKLPLIENLDVLALY